MTIAQNGQHLVVTDFPKEAIQKDFSQKLSSIGTVSNVKIDSATTASFTLTMHRGITVEKSRKELVEYETLCNESSRV